MKTFKDRVRELRSQKKISQTKLAMAVSVDKSSVSKWESGERVPSLDVAIRVADYFSVSLDFLMGATNDPLQVLPYDVVAQNVIYEDESDAEIVNLFIKSGIANKPTTVKLELEDPSPEALAFARDFDDLDRHGREVLRAVLRIEAKRCEEMRSLRAYTCIPPEN